MARSPFDGLRNDLLDVQGASASFQHRLRTLTAPLPLDVQARLVTLGADLERTRLQARAMQRTLAPVCAAWRAREAA